MASRPDRWHLRVMRLLLAACALRPTVRADLALHPTEMTTVRRYLASVYPTADVGVMSDTDALRTFLAAEYFYDVPALGSPLPRELLQAAGADLVTNQTYECEDGFYDFGLTRKSMHVRFARVHDPPSAEPVCVGHLKQCAERGMGYVPPQHAWGVHATAPVFRVPDGTHLEVSHFWQRVYGSTQHPKGEAPQHWGEFIDPAPAGWWFHVTPGTGIFYETGRMLVAPNKNALMLQLLREFERTVSGPERAAFESAARTTLTHFSMVLLGSTQLLEKTLQGTNCDQLALHCRRAWILADEYDALLIGLGRILRYDSLALSASPLFPDPCRNAFVPEVVDLRLPPRSELFAAKRAQLIVGLAPGWSRAQADELVREYESSSRLTLRDPLRRADPSRARPCNFTGLGPTVRLACFGHVSWQVREVGDVEYKCVPRGDAPRIRSSKSQPRQGVCQRMAQRGRVRAQAAASSD